MKRFKPHVRALVAVSRLDQATATPAPKGKEECLHVFPN